MRDMSEPVWELGFAMDNLDEEDLTVLVDLQNGPAVGQPVLGWK
jgi:hypothetical protein